MVRRFAVVLLVALPALAGATTPSSITITSSPNPSVFGQVVTLTGTVSPSAATGSVTFYDGTTVLGTNAIAGGKAKVTTVLLASGTRSLKAYYGGNTIYAGSTSALLAQTVTPIPAIRFQPGSSIALGNTQQSVAVGDFDGDGKGDLAVTNIDSSGLGFINVLLGSGDGTFLAPVSYASGSAPYSVAVGDFNGDGKTDLAAVSREDNKVSVLLGNGDGTFGTAVTYSVGAWPRTIAVGDFNGDGKADVATANEISMTVSVLLGNGDGTFLAAVDSVVGEDPIGLAVGDFNGDGKADLVTTEANGMVRILLGHGDGSFREPGKKYGDMHVRGQVAIGDFNRDGKEDLAVATDATVRVLLGNGDGTFQAPVLFSGVPNPTSIAMGDFDGDGKEDLAVATDAAVRVLLGNGDGTFQPVVNYSVPGNANYVAVGEFNGDGRADLAVAANFDPSGNNVSLLMGKGPTSGDITPPLVSLVQTIAGPPKKVQLGSTDPGSGLAAVTVLKCTNCNAITDSFLPGTNGTVLTTATKIDSSKSSLVKLQAIDEAGNVTVFDPTDLTVESEGKPSVSTVEVSPREYIVQIVNGTPGIHTLMLTANGMKIPIFFLKNGETRTINIRHALLPGQPNTVKVTAFGRPGGSTWIVFTEP